METLGHQLHVEVKITSNFLGEVHDTSTFDEAFGAFGAQQDMAIVRLSQ